MLLPLPRLSMLPVFLRELVGRRTLPREPEPALVMDDPEQVAAYAEAGRIDGVMAASYLFHTARISQVIQGCRKVVDLGCGPATQLCQVARFNPDTEFLGLDLSDDMLADARRHAAELGLTNVVFERGDMSRLEGIADASVDGVISTMAFHHLPTLEHLRNCFSGIARILRPQGACYLVDFGRLKSLESVIYFAYMNRERQPHLFSLDYERSLRAAFTAEELETLTRELLPPQVSFYTTFQVPFLVAIKSRDRSLPAVARARLHELRLGLPRRYRRDLDDLRLFFRLGGMGNDPFR